MKHRLQCSVTSLHSNTHTHKINDFFEFQEKNLFFGKKTQKFTFLQKFFHPGHESQLIRQNLLHMFHS